MSDSNDVKNDHDDPKEQGRANNGPSEDTANSRRHTFLIALLTGLIGILGTVIGSAIQADYASDAQKTDLQEERKREDREQKRDAYSEFLRTFDETSSASLLFYNCLVLHQTTETPGPCDSNAASLKIAYAKLQYIIRSKVAVYGSKEAITLAKELREELPMIRPGGWRKNQYDYSPRDYNHGLINNKTDGFAAMMCSELPALPRSDCTPGS